MKKHIYPNVGDIIAIKGKIFEIVYDEACSLCYFHRNGYCELTKANENTIHCINKKNIGISYKLIGKSIV